MAERSTNTMAEMMKRFMRDIADAKQMPDADMDFLSAMEQMLLEYIKSPMGAMQDAGQLPSGPPMGSPMGMPMGGPGAMGGQLPQAGGLMPGAAPNADELRRLLA